MEITDVDRARTLIEDFLEEQQVLLSRISSAVSSVFEGLCLIYVAQCYRDELHYELQVNNAVNGEFRFKCTTMGNPNHFSSFLLTKDSIEYELHHNLAVSGGRDPEPIYFVDIALIKKGSIKYRKSFRKGRTHSVLYCENQDLITFAECKHIVAYSMLIAYFLGIVFELKPEHLEGNLHENLLKQFSNHIFPSLLISSGTHIGAETVIDSIKNRKYSVIIAADLFKTPRQLFQEVQKCHSCSLNPRP
jgi:hypothetical protein